jgi:hypothetical protein
VKEVAVALKDVEGAIRHGRKIVKTHPDLAKRPEYRTRYAIVDPIIRALGWETYSPDECVVEYRCKKRKKGNSERVDYALLSQGGTPVILIEAKWLDNVLSTHVRTLAGYARAVKPEVCVLTDGRKWQIYDLSKRGWFKNKQVDTVDICEQGINQMARTLNKWLGKREWR